ncbi:ROK family transcriptional regulator [Aquincola sp. MAHUQ-54]|uniref:ROK family transcriptional regulator n=1 Tax=Aquincola agrisoli TaxID=3119538 RepID=A0AAW9QBS3_9BURK
MPRETVPHAQAFAPEDHRLRPRGSSQGGLRQYNERVVLQAIRLHGALPAAEIARLTQLTAQTVSQITKRLLDDGLLVKGEPVRGKVGQPSVPLALAPEGAYAIGIKVGRRSLDVLLVDFTGAACQRASVAYDYPEPEAVTAAIDAHLREMRQGLGAGRRERLQGIGLAAPLSLGGWQTLLGVESERARAWDRVDLPERVAAMSGLPVTFVKDTAAACVAELVAGRGRNVRSFLYVFVDTFIGGGLVLDSHLRGGLSGNAGAVGSLAMGRARPGGPPPPQLLSVASLFTLETMYRAAGLDPVATVDACAMQPPWLACTQAWLDEAAPAIALALHDAACLLDLEGVIIDGQFSRELLAALLAAVESACRDLSWEGVRRPAVLPGTIGPDARALGGALLPLHANFAPDRDLFLKLEAPAAKL